MTESDEKTGFMELIKDGMMSISKIIASSVFAPLAEGSDLIMKRIEERIICTQRRIMYELFSLVIIGFGAILLTFALLSFLKEILGWSNSSALFFIGTIIIMIGFLIKARSRIDEKNNR